MILAAVVGLLALVPGDALTELRRHDLLNRMAVAAVDVRTAVRVALLRLVAAVDPAAAAAPRAFRPHRARPVGAGVGALPARRALPARPCPADRGAQRGAGSGAVRRLARARPRTGGGRAHDDCRAAGRQ